jgi:succinate dehydrogenase/fumarate reductase flavoprotein subunit
MKKAMNVDVIVAGSGSAGMATAIVAAKSGLKVLLVEKSPYFGGATALSGGGCWIPNNHQMASIGASDTPDAGLQYLQAVVGNWLRPDLAEAFLTTGPEMVDFMLSNTSVQMMVRPGPDYFPDRAGGSNGGRAFTPMLFDGRELGRDVRKIRPPLKQFNAPWGMMMNLVDMHHGLAAHHSIKSAFHMLKLFARYAADKVVYGRGTRLVMGNALVGRLFKSALDAGVALWTESPIIELIRDDQGVAGAVIRHEGVDTEVQASCGVVLATGGFAANDEMRARFFPLAEQTLSLMPTSNTGDGLALAIDAGGVMEKNNATNAVWSALSRYRQPDGTILPCQHFLDLGRPGAIAVNRDGRRFANEATQFVVQKMYETGSIPAWIICDAKFIHKYGLGLVLPRGMRLKRLLREGYLQSAPTLSALAEKIGVDGANLIDTVKEANAAARVGHGDPMGKGDGGFDRYMGDASHEPSPNLGPIESGPFYAVEVFPGDTGSTLGLRVSARGEVLDKHGGPIPGLYACGLDMNSIWAGLPPANGANHGANMTFGYIIGRWLAQQKAQGASASPN